jgi:hypothetical protein
MNTKAIVGLVGGVLLFILLLVMNPLSWNDAGNRTVVEQAGGNQFVEFTPGVFYAGFFAKETEWPNQISVMYNEAEPDLDLVDNGIQVGMIKIMFNDGTTADVKGIAQFVLPSDEKDMILIHNTHRTPQSLVTKRLATFTKECLQSSAQSMSSDKHYGGGRAQMSQDFLDQLRNGVYISETQEKVTYDSIEKEKKRLYITSIKRDKQGVPERKTSAIAEYSISVADASIVDTDYAPVVDEKLGKIIEAATKSAVSRQELMTAQQQSLTAKAKGEQALVEIEYQQKQEQTKQVVEAETKVKVAEQDKLQQKVAFEGAIFEAKKRQTLADVAAYEKRTTIQADGALKQKLDTYIEVQKAWADAFGKYTGNVVPTFQTGGNIGPYQGNGSSNGAVSFMEIMSAKAARDLSLELNNKKQ